MAVTTFTMGGGGPGGGLADGDYGAVTVSGSGTVMALTTAAVDPITASCAVAAQGMADAAQAAAEATAASLAPNLVEAVLDFGNGEVDAVTPITAAWATPTSKITVSIVDDARIKEAIIQQIVVGISGRGAGAFDIHGHAPEGAEGQFTVHALGV